MTAPRPGSERAADKPLDEPLRFSLNEPVELDVTFCDAFRSREPSHTGLYELRLRGVRQPDGIRVRGFVPLAELEGGLLGAKVILSPVNVDAIPPGERAFLEVPLLHYALTITKRRKGNGDWWYEVVVRDGAGAGDVAQYARCLKDAGEAARALTAQGYPVGSEDIISIADSLFLVRINRGEGVSR